MSERLEIHATHSCVRFIGITLVGAPAGAQERLVFATEILAGNFPLRIHMPCGCLVEYADESELPLWDTHCPCGAENHLVVRWES